MNESNFKKTTEQVRIQGRQKRTCHDHPAICKMMDDFGENIWDVSSWTSDINWKDGHLRRYFDTLQFEQCIREVLDIVETYFQSAYKIFEENEDEDGVENEFPYLDIITLLAEEYLYGQFFYALTSLQELQMLEILCRYFQESKIDGVRYFVFDCIFGLPTECIELQKGLLSFKMDVITKLTSLAVGTGCGNVLNCVAVWMSTYGLFQHRAARVAFHVLNDYCYICPNSLHVIKDLINISPVFANQFVVALYDYYKEVITDTEISSHLPPVAMVNIIATWIVDQPNFCAVKIPRLFLQLPSVHKFITVAERKIFKVSPLLSLLEWCLLEPLVRTAVVGDEFCKLHYAFLNYICLQKKSEPASVEHSDDDLEPGELQEDMSDSTDLFMKYDIYYLIDFLKLNLNAQKGDIDEHRKLECVDRLLQVIQVGKWSKACSMPTKELLSQLSLLPSTRLKDNMVKLL